MRTKSLFCITIKSYETYNREYLLEANGSYISDVSLLRWLRDITKLDGITFNMMQSIYITALNKKGTTLNDRKQLSTQMRNSVGAQSLHYYKVGTYDGKTNDELIQMTEELAARIGLLEKTQEKTDKEPIEFDDKAFKKNRQDLLCLNNKDGYKSTAATSEKY